MLHAGIDLGGTKIEIRVLDDNGQQQFVTRCDTPRGSYPLTLNAIVSLVQKAEDALSQPCTLGIGIPGAIDPHNGRVKNANSTWLIGQQLDKDLAELLNRSVKVANDADCMTLSEAVDGAGANGSVVFGVILGTGVGGGIAVQQRLLSGPNAICGEWGHNPLPWPVETDITLPCFCGHKGCIETFISGPGLCQQYQQLSGVTVTRAEAILAAAEAGDATAQQTLSQFYEQVAKSLASVINILDPDCIVLAGGLSNMQSLYREIPNRWQRYVLSDQVFTQLAQAKYGDSSGARGAAWLGAG